MIKLLNFCWGRITPRASCEALVKPTVRALFDYDRITTIYKKCGTSRFFINLLNPTPGWLIRRRMPSGRKATTFLRPSMRFSNLNYSRQNINSIISRSRANFTSKLYKLVSPNFNDSLRNINYYLKVTNVLKPLCAGFCFNEFLQLSD